MNANLSRLLPLPLLAATGLLCAAEVNMNPGLWTWTSHMEMPGMNMQLPSHTHTECLTREKMIPSNRNPGQECVVEDTSITADSATWQVTCQGPEGVSTGHGKMNYSGDSAQGEMAFTAQGMQMTMRMRGRRTGPCQ